MNRKSSCPNRWSEKVSQLAVTLSFLITNRMSSAEMTLDPRSTAPSHACCSYTHTHRLVADAEMRAQCVCVGGGGCYQVDELSVDYILHQSSGIM